MDGNHLTHVTSKSGGADLSDFHGREKEGEKTGRLHSLGHSEIKEGHEDPFQQQGLIARVYAQDRPITFGRRHCEQSLHNTGGRQLQCLPEVGVGSNPP